MATPGSTLPEFIFTVQNLSLGAESSSDSEEERDCSCCDEAACSNSRSSGLGDCCHEHSGSIECELQDVLNSSGIQASEHASTTTSAPSLDLNISASSLSSYHLDWGLSSSTYSSPSGVKRPRRQRLAASSISSQASVTKHPEPPVDHSDTVSEPSPRTDHALKKLRPRRRSSQVVPPSASPAVPVAVFASVSPTDTVIHMPPSASHESRMLLPAKQATLQPPVSLSRVLARDASGKSPFGMHHI